MKLKVDFTTTGKHDITHHRITASGSEHISEKLPAEAERLQMFQQPRTRLVTELN